MSTPRLRDFLPGRSDTQELEQDLDEPDSWTTFLSDPWTALHQLSQHLKGVPYASVFLAKACRFFLRVLLKKVRYWLWYMSTYIYEVCSMMLSDMMLFGQS